MFTKMEGAMQKINYRRVVLGCLLFLLVALIATQILPLFFDEPGLINQTAMQSTRAQRIAKDALVMAYRSSDEHSQAVSEMQDTLPQLEAEQIQLRTLMSPDAQLLVTESQPDYAAIDTAAQMLLAHPTDPTDITQVTIILEHERNYALTMSQLAVLRQTKIQESNLVLVASQCVISLLIIVLVAVFFVLSRQSKQNQKGDINGQTQQ
jgi:hypothetical protein